MQWVKVWMVVTALLAVVGAAGAAEAAPAAAPPAAGEGPEPHVLYMPLMHRGPGYLGGHVTQNGANAANVPVRLRFFNGSAWSVLRDGTTDASGNYHFYNVPALAAGQRYQVVFENPTQDPARLAWWGTKELTGYATGSAVNIGNFDVADVALVAPQHQELVGLPYPFRWTRRPGVPGDNYAVRLYDGDFIPVHVTSYVGYTETATLLSLPAGFSPNTPYNWDVVLQSPDGGTGVSRQARSVRLGNGIYGRVTLNGAPISGVALQLRFYNGSVWTTISNTTTLADGSFAFVNAPTLAAGQRYYVRYENAAQTDGRLFLWSTRELSSFVAGSSVEIGNFDIADVALQLPGGGATVSLPYAFQWVRRPATTGDSYGIEIYDPADYSPRWLSPLVGYNGSYTLSGLDAALSTNTNYAWDVIISAADGGSGVSRMARQVRFANRGTRALNGESAGGVWLFPEELPLRPAESIEGGQ
jgi:5-hydroxyisourate hydrolase-like protein (transthyretin family)